MKLVLSPHMDDAALSLGGFLLNASHQGGAHVITVFDSVWTCEETALSAGEVNALSIAENNAVMRELGCTCDYWGYPEGYARGYAQWHSPLDMTKDMELYEAVRERVYEALARGKIGQDEFSISAPVGRHPADRKKQAVLPNGREAVTYARVLARYPGYTHIQCRLGTGRTHQIRVHLAHIGHPLAGDGKYGGKQGELGLETQCLHAKELAFTHPRTGERLHFISKLPDFFLGAIAKISV